MPIIKIPSQLRNYADNQATVNVKGSNVQEAINDLISQHNGLKDRLMDENEKVRRFVNIFLGDEDIRFLDNMDTQLEESSELSIIPAIAGGK